VVSWHHYVRDADWFRAIQVQKSSGSDEENRGFTCGVPRSLEASHFFRVFGSAICSIEKGTSETTNEDKMLITP